MEKVLGSRLGWLLLPALNSIVVFFSKRMRDLLLWVPRLQLSGSESKSMRPLTSLSAHSMQKIIAIYNEEGVDLMFNAYYRL